MNYQLFVLTRNTIYKQKKKLLSNRRIINSNIYIEYTTYTQYTSKIMLKNYGYTAYTLIQLTNEYKRLKPEKCLFVKKRKIFLKYIALFVLRATLVISIGNAISDHS